MRNTLSAVRNAPRRWQRVMRWIPVSRVLKPRSSSKQQQQQLLRRQQREAVGRCGRRDAASQLRSPLRLWFSVFSAFQQKTPGFFCHDGAHFFLTSRTMNPMFVFHLFGYSLGFFLPFCLSSVWWSSFLPNAGPERWGDPRASPRMEASGLAAWTGTWAPGAESEATTSTPTRSL